jgi:F-type H+-transporting ATPase subunit delta
MADTKNMLIAKRYAQALVDISKEGKLTFDEITKNLALIDNTLNLSQDLEDFLKSPIVSLEDKKSTFEQVFGDEINQMIKNFVYVLFDKNRFSLFKDIEMAYFDFVDKINNISRIEVVSAVQLTEENRKKIEEKLSVKLNSKVAVDYKIDENIIEGLLIKIGDNIIDTSLRHKLEKMEMALVR